MRVPEFHDAAPFVKIVRALAEFQLSKLKVMKLLPHRGPKRTKSLAKDVIEVKVRIAINAKISASAFRVTTRFFVFFISQPPTNFFTSLPENITIPPPQFVKCYF